MPRGGGEQQVTGVDHGYEYDVTNPTTGRGVKFDGYDKDTDSLTDAKFGYSGWKWVDAEECNTKA